MDDTNLDANISLDNPTSFSDMFPVDTSIDYNPLIDPLPPLPDTVPAIPVPWDQIDQASTANTGTTPQSTSDSAQGIANAINSIIGSGLGIFGKISTIKQANDVSTAQADAARAAALVASTKAQTDLANAQAALARAQQQSVKPSTIPNQVWLYAGIGVLVLLMMKK